MAGLFVRIRSRPFNVLAYPQKAPRCIFVKAIETAPFVPSIHRQLKGREEPFLEGLRCLLRLTQGKVHVVTSKDSPIHSLCQSLPIDIHTVEGPHPAANQSLHIQHIDPIVSTQDIVWTVNLLDTIAFGEYSLFGNLAVEQVIAVAGTGIKQSHRRFVKTLPGICASSLLENGLIEETTHIISGDPLTGTLISSTDFLRNDTVLTVLPEPSTNKEFLPFMQTKSINYTATNTYVKGEKSKWPFTTSRHGEQRPFIDEAIYDRIMPFSVLPMFLIKALLANDLDRAIEYGLLEIIPEDFALADFICPSKIGMMQIVLEGQQQYYH
jgi:Na+-transporting NADH:ubiquinone oxidoreductase subunit A